MTRNQRKVRWIQGEVLETGGDKPGNVPLASKTLTPTRIGGNGVDNVGREGRVEIWVGAKMATQI